jgi:hypothetical protein
MNSAVRLHCAELFSENTQRLFCVLSRDSSVNTVSDNGLDKSGVGILAEFSFLHAVHTVPKFTDHRFQIVSQYKVGSAFNQLNTRP